MRKPPEFLCCAARHALEGKSNFVIAARDGRVIVQGSDTRDVLAADVRGASLYSFCEPSMEELLAAHAAGVEKVYCGISKQDAIRCGLVPLTAKKLQRTREEILTKYVEKWNE